MIGSLQFESPLYHRYGLLVCRWQQQSMLFDLVRWTTAAEEYEQPIFMALDPL